MLELQVRWADAGGIVRLDRAMRALGEQKFRVIGNRVVNRTGDMARTHVRKALTRQTGLKRVVIVKAVRVTPSSPATLTYRMSAQGGDIALKFFSPRETRAGVSAAPFGVRKVFPGTFIKGGRFPDRKGVVFHGHVMKREGASHFPILVQQSGVIIPEEMVKGETASGFQRIAREVLPRRMMHEIRRATGGVFG